MVFYSVFFFFGSMAMEPPSERDSSSKSTGWNLEGMVRNLAARAESKFEKFIRSLPPADQELVRGIRAGDEAVVAQALTNGAQADRLYGGGTFGTPLHLAIKSRSERIIQMLVARKANINGDPLLLGYPTPLQRAAALGYADMVQILLALGGINVDISDSAGNTALSLAVSAGNREVVRLLLEHKKGNLDAAELRRILNMAFNKPDILYLIMQKTGCFYGDVLGALTADISHWDRHAIADHSRRIIPHVRALISQNNKQEVYADLLAALDWLKRLLDQNHDGPGLLTVITNQLYEASAVSDRNRVLWSLVAGADLRCNRDGMWPWQVARDQVLEFLMDWLAGPENRLFTACATGDIGLIRVLVNSGCDSNGKKKKEITPLLLACLSGHENIARLLLESGASVDALHQSSLLLSDIARSRNCPLIVKLLQEAGAQGAASNPWSPAGMRVRFMPDVAEENRLEQAREIIRLRDEQLRFQQVAHTVPAPGGFQAHPSITSVVPNVVIPQPVCHKRERHDEKELMLRRRRFFQAATKGNCRVIEFLLTAGIPVDARNHGQWTALHLAAASGHADVIRVLLRAGAERNALTPIGQTALVLAALSSHQDIVDILQGSGSQGAASNPHFQASQPAARVVPPAAAKGPTICVKREYRCDQETEFENHDEGEVFNEKKPRVLPPDRYYVFLQPVQRGDVNGLRAALLDSDVNPNDIYLDGRTLLELAAHHENPDIAAQMVTVLISRMNIQNPVDVRNGRTLSENMFQIGRANIAIIINNALAQQCIPAAAQRRRIDLESGMPL
jgi:ankyrin repeat protein